MSDSQVTVTCTRCGRHVFTTSTIERDGKRVCDPANEILGHTCRQRPRANKTSTVNNTAENSEP